MCLSKPLSSWYTVDGGLDFPAVILVSVAYLEATDTEHWDQQIKEGHQDFVIRHRAFLQAVKFLRAGAFLCVNGLVAFLHNGKLCPRQKLKVCFWMVLLAGVIGLALFPLVL